MCNGIAERQLGLITRRQALSAGVGRGGIERRVQAAKWRARQPSIYAISPFPNSWRQRLLAAVLWAGRGAVASHRSAAALFGLSAGDANIVEISGPTSKTSGTVVVHRIAPLQRRDLAYFGPIPSTDATRTMIDLASVLTPEGTEDVVLEGLQRRLTSLPRLKWRLDRLGSRGRKGCASLRRFTDELDQYDAVPHSGLELRFGRLLKTHGVPSPRAQYRVVTDNKRIAQVDFAYPEHRLAIETDGWAFHSSVDAWRRDLRRGNQLVLAGWKLLRITREDLLRRETEVVAQLRQALTANPANQ